MAGDAKFDEDRRPCAPNVTSELTCTDPDNRARQGHVDANTDLQLVQVGFQIKPAPKLYVMIFVSYIEDICNM